MLVALLGVMKAGAAYVPLDPAFPADRQRFMLEDGDRPLITQNPCCVDARARPSARSASTATQPGLADESGAAGAREPAPADLAYVIYTSGSTGRPKGVQIPHRALANFLASAGRSSGSGRDDVLVAVTTLSFDIAGLELFLPLRRRRRAS